MKILTIVLSLLLVTFTACSNGGNGETDAGQDAYDAGGGDEIVFCQNIDSCPSGHLCMGGYCQPGVECHDPADCPADYECHFLKNVCIPTNLCESNDDCTESSAPHCMTSSGMCVACLDDNHCSSPDASICGPDWTCVECTEDGQCDGEMICHADHYCVDPTGCESDTDCTDSAKPYCNTTDGQCYACVTDAHCVGAAVCEPTSDQCVACYQDAHCTGTEGLCHLATFTCVVCLDDEDCLPGEHCHSVSHECTTFYCQDDSDCTEPATSWCNVSTGDCVECVVTDHCGFTDWCRNFQCESGCLTDAECIEKYGANQHCNTDTDECFEAECLSDNDCSGTPERPHCKTAAVPSNPPQYTCVECTDDAHCDEFFECHPAEFTCFPMPCYGYDEPDVTCHQIDPCYYCDMIEGTCGPAYNCTYPDGSECCQGYTCNSYGHCERNTSCASDLDCPVDATCNTTTGACEIVPCCEPPCSSGEYCNSLCVCLSTCHDLGEPCDPMSQNCCEGLMCSMFWPMCTEI